MRSTYDMKKIGLHFGYPKCCVDEFVRDLDNGLSPARLRNPHPMNRTGFIPCLKHSEEIKKLNIPFHSPEKIIEALSKLVTNRKHIEPFPFCDKFNGDDFIIKLKRKAVRITDCFQKGDHYYHVRAFNVLHINKAGNTINTLERGHLLDDKVNLELQRISKDEFDEVLSIVINALGISGYIK